MTNGIVIKNEREVIAAFRRVLSVTAEEGERFIREGLNLLQGELADYPPPPQGSQYRRTGTLGRLWTSGNVEFVEYRNALEGRTGNATPYGPYVQGSRQAAVHRGRWRTTEQVVKDAEGKLNRLLSDFAEAIERESTK